MGIFSNPKPAPLTLTQIDASLRIEAGIWGSATGGVRARSLSRIDALLDRRYALQPVGHIAGTLPQGYYPGLNLPPMPRP